MRMRRLFPVLIRPPYLPEVQSILVISTSFILNNRLSRSEIHVPV